VVDGVVRPVAFVVAPDLAPAEVITRLRRLLEPAFVPRRVVQVAALPRNDTGKLTVQALRDFAAGHLGNAAP
jgi:acyl-coenzyme A synthetase/AMP-(fatty) acid ligase